MPKRGKKFRAAAEKRDKLKRYPVSEAFTMVSDLSTTKFDATVDVAVRLGVDPTKSDQNIRSAVSLPHGTGKVVRVVAFAKDEKAEEAKAAGADVVGAEDIVEKIQGGWMEFDKTVATPDMMRVISKVSRVLGPRGLMPNPKVGTVTPDIAKAVKEQKAGKVSFRVDKGGNIHAGIGKSSFGSEKLTDNFKELLSTLIKLKPATSKGVYLKNISVSSTMSPGVRVDVADAQGLVKK
jgi:large subunit ribosomal protein L1